MGVWARIPKQVWIWGIGLPWAIGMFQIINWAFEPFKYFHTMTTGVGP